MPSVPKYFRAIFPKPAKGRPFPMIGQLPEIFKKNERFLRLWLKGAAGRGRGGLNGAARYFRFRRVGAGWVTLIGSEAGKLSSRPCSSDRSSLRLRTSSRSRLVLSSSSSSTTVRFGIAMDVLLASDALDTLVAGRAVVQITRGTWLAFPHQGSRISDQ